MELNLNEQNSALIAGMSQISCNDVTTEQQGKTFAQKTLFLRDKSSQLVDETNEESFYKATLVSQDLDKESRIPKDPYKNERVTFHQPLCTTRNVTFDEIKHLLPRTKFTTNDTKIIKCRYPDCTAIGSEITCDYCPDHFTQRYNEGEFDLPLPDHQASQTLPTTSNKPTMRQTRSTLVFNDVDNITINGSRILVNGEDVATNLSRRTARKQPRSKEEKVGIKKGNPDIIESSGSDDEICYGCMRKCKDCSRQLCRSVVCFNQGKESYNGLCEECYNVLQQCAVFRIRTPTPDVYPRKPREKVRAKREEIDHKSNCRRTHGSRCQKCRAHIKGGCFCARCFHSNRESTDKDNTERMGAAGKFSRRHVLSSPADAHRLYQTHREYYTDPRPSCPCITCRSHDGTKSRNSCVVRDLGTDACFTSMQPSDTCSDSDEYIMSIGDDDFKRKYSHFPNDRG